MANGKSRSFPQKVPGQKCPSEPEGERQVTVLSTGALKCVIMDVPFVAEPLPVAGLCAPLSSVGMWKWGEGRQGNTLGTP